LSPTHAARSSLAPMNLRRVSGELSACMGHLACQIRTSWATVIPDRPVEPIEGCGNVSGQQPQIVAGSLGKIRVVRRYRDEFEHLLHLALNRISRSHHSPPFKG
jgi:hypothetical protein